MNNFEREAIATFMNQVFQQMHPNHDEYGLDEIEKIYEQYGEDSEQFEEIPLPLQQAFYMRRSRDVINGEKKYV